jgi:hypothetical protein
VRKKRQLSVIEQWAQQYRVGDIGDLLRRSTLGLSQERGCYYRIIDGIQIATGQSPSETRRRAIKALERLIRTPGISKHGEVVVTPDDLRQAAVSATQAIRSILRLRDIQWNSVRRTSNRI